MPIELKYGNPGNTLIAAYAGGRNRANNRRAAEMLQYLDRQRQREFEASRQMQHEQFATEQQNRTFAQQRSLLGLEQGQRFQQQQQLANAEAQARGEPLPFPDLANPTNQPAAITDQRGRFSFTGQTSTIDQQPGSVMTPFQQRQALQDRQLQQQSDLQDRQFQQQSNLEDQRFISEGLRSGHLEYTPAQEQRLAGLQDSVQKVLDDQTLDEGQREIALTELNRRIRSVRPIPKRADKQPRPIVDQVRETVHWDGGEWGKGTPWIVDPKTGAPQVPRGWSAPKPAIDNSAKIQADQNRQNLALQHAKATYAAKLMSFRDDGGNSVYTPDQAWDEAGKRFDSVAPRGSATQQPNQSPSTGQQPIDPKQTRLRAINEEVEALVSLGDSRTPDETRRMMALKREEDGLSGLRPPAGPEIDAMTTGTPFGSPTPQHTDTPFTQGTTQTGGNVPRVSNDDEWRSLPSGATFIGPDGRRYRKK